VLSRVASSIYWLNRYIERAENYARFIEVNHQLAMDIGLGQSDQWMPLIYTTGDDQLFLQRYKSPKVSNVIYFLTFDLENPNSIYSCLARARENARTIRENISQAMWEVLNEFFLEVKRIQSEIVQSNSLDSITLDTPIQTQKGDKLLDFFRFVRLNCFTFYGVTDSTISHDDVYHFANIGRSLERADKSTRILDMKYFILLPHAQDEEESTEDLIQWLYLLKSASAHEMYNKVYNRILPLYIAEFIVQSPEFPRSIYFCVEEIRKSVDIVSGFAPRDYAWDSPNRMVNHVLSEISKVNLEEVFLSGFHEYIDRLQIELNQLGDSIHRRFFET